ncbi:MAG: hypothetical protein QOH61_1964 [Chloroflexota bacterium]|nr:hypothetical protein [Chloroflexota bacterium]
MEAGPGRDEEARQSEARRLSRARCPERARSLSNFVA